jgi:hypothetical protein
MQTASIRVRQKDSVYRIEDPQSQLCIRLHSVPATTEAAPHIVPRLTRRELSTWFTTRAQADEAFARYIGVAALEIVRSDA